jgi:hypothetical protein
MIMENYWKVDVKGSQGSDSFEISVIRSENAHGFASYGWFGKDKLLISHSGGPCKWPLEPIVWSKMIELAHDVAREMNEKEFGY